MPQDNIYQQVTLNALNVLGKHVYAGTANKKKVAKARRRNRQATINRRINLAKGV